MYNLFKYRKNYWKTTGCLWNYYRDEPNSDIGGENNNVIYSIKDLKSFDYKTSITVTLKVLRQQRMFKLLYIKTFKQFLNNTRHAINWLWNKFYFYMVW